MQNVSEGAEELICTITDKVLKPLLENSTSYDPSASFLREKLPSSSLDVEASFF